MPIPKSLKKIKSKLPESVKLIAVSKTKPVEDVLKAYEAGQRVFGENKAQEMSEKQPLLPADIEWHFIGHLQSNKVKYIAPFVKLVHSVDSVKLLGEINKHAFKNARIIDCLLQFHIATEESKFGLNLREALSILESDYLKSLKNIRIVGVMGMATLTEDYDLIRSEFNSLKASFDEMKDKYFPEDDSFSEISMGMSDDFSIAVEEGSTLVRVGSAIFGSRN